MTTNPKPTIILCGPPITALGGGPTHIRNLLNSPLKDRFDLIHFEAGSRGIESPAEEESAIAMLRRLVVSPWALAWHLWRRRPMLVHINSAMDNKAFWRDCVYLGVCKVFRRPVVFQLHGGLLQSICPNRFAKWVVRRCFRLADAVVLLASIEKRDFDRIGIDGRVVVIPNGIDMRDYKGAATRVHSGRVRRLAYLGRLIRQKGVFEAIEAIRVLRNEHGFADIELGIAGTGPALDEIRAYIARYGLDKHVKMLGSVVGSEKALFLESADAFVFPSYHQEGLPYSVIESLAAGTPVIVSRAGGIPDVVIDGVHGLFVEPRDPESLIDALRRLSASPDHLRDMSRHCHQWARDKLGLERLAVEFAALYEAVSSESRRPPVSGSYNKRINRA